ncbi:MAG: alpha/beta hydrolase [Salinarimonas sp.]
MIFVRGLTTLFTPLLLAGCASAGLAIANFPVAWFDGEVIEDISYGEEPWEKLDIYIPPGKAEAGWPVIVFFYGGRWTDGSREDYAFVGSALAAKGFVTVVPDYRKYPVVRFPAFVEDGAKAVSWVHDNIGQNNGRADKLFLAGHSAGAHIAALLVSDERYLQNEGGALSSIQGFAGLAGPYDFTPEAADLKEIFGPPSNYPQMQVTTFVDGTEPPMLLLHGDADQTVERYNLERLANMIEDRGGRVESTIYPELDHIEILGALSWFWRNKAPVLDDISEYFMGLAE